MTGTEHSRAVGAWLLGCCLLLLIIILVGGATRLTGSGLSIVEWRPVTGILPPLTDAAWRDELEKYRQSPEYQKINRGMSLDDFKKIYWYEYGHRVLARLLGLAVALPLIWFWLSGRLPPNLRKPMVGLLLLGALQGYMGWYMVSSGLVDIPRVSPYRLAAHLSLALIIFAIMWRLALSQLWPGKAASPPVPGIRRFTAPLLILVALTIIWGAFVAGLRAGFIYNTFPLMGGKLVPDGVFFLEPGWLNFFENPATVQFFHRVLAVLALLFVIVAWASHWRHIGDKVTRFAFHGVLLAALLQVTLGITTLLLYAPTPLAVIHQGGAVMLLSVVLLADWFATRKCGDSQA